MLEFLSEYLTLENGLLALEWLFWPALWTVTYVCFLALLVAALQQIYRRAGFGDQSASVSGPTPGRAGLSLMLAGVLGLAACSLIWEVMFGDLGRAATLLVASHLHGAQDYREITLLVLSTISVLAADIGSLIFLDQFPTR